MDNTDIVISCPHPPSQDICELFNSDFYHFKMYFWKNWGMIEKLLSESFNSQSKYFNFWVRNANWKYWFGFYHHQTYLSICRNPILTSETVIRIKKVYDIKTLYLPFIIMMILGKPPKQIFGKSWDFVPRRGVWPNPNFYKALFLWHIWPFFAENFRKIHGKNPNVRGGGVKPIGPNSQLYRKFVSQAPFIENRHQARPSQKQRFLYLLVFVEQDTSPRQTVRGLTCPPK